LNFLFWPLLLLCSVLTTISHGQSVDTSEDVSFFDVEDTGADDNFFDIDVDTDEETETEINSPYSVNGSVRQEFTYGIANPGSLFAREQKGIEKIKSELFLQLQGKPAANLKLKASGLVDYEWGSWRNDAYSLGDMSANFELKDLFLDLTTDSGLWVRIGNQILARGEFDTIKMTDVINPIDLSAPAQVELKDIRIQVPALFLSAPVGAVTTELIVTHDAGFDKFGTLGPGSSFDFSLLTQQSLALLPENVSVVSEEQEPNKSWEAVSRVNYKLNGGDVSLTFGEVNWNQNSLHSIKESSPLIMEYGYDRVKVVGLSGNLARSDYLFRYETALHDGRKFQTIDPLLAWAEHKQIVAAIGLDYNGLSDTVLSAELNNTNIMDYSESLVSEENAMGYLIQARWSGFNDLLSIYGAFNKLSGDESSIANLFIEYDLSDSLQVDGRLIIYDAKSVSDLFNTFKDQDVIKASLKYSF